MPDHPTDPSPAAPLHGVPHRPETTAITAGRRANQGSLSTPLWATTAYEQATLEEAGDKAVTPRV